MEMEEREEEKEGKGEVMGEGGWRRRKTTDRGVWGQIA